MIETNDQAAVLIVDDTPANLRVLTQLLTEHGYRARPVPSGAYALSSLQSGLPDLILLDIMMPDMDGYEVCRRIKAVEAYREIPVIFISALDETVDKVKGFAAGGVDYITKPFQDEEVLARVQTHLALRQLQQQLVEKNQALAAANDTLESKVVARTAALAQTNDTLQAEIEQRKRHQVEKDRLFVLVQQQSDQLQLMARSLLEAQKSQRQGLSTGLEVQIQGKITLLRTSLDSLPAQIPPPVPPRLTAYLAETGRVLAEMEGYLRQVTSDLGQSAAAERDMQADLLLQLSARERQVLRLLMDGKSASAISDLLTVTPSTVQTYIKRIRQKFNLPNLASLIAFAQEHFGA
jgi:DNA-binding response OmpR family regulator/DNA-binding CsgD family transcriptional regulator